MSDQTAPPAAAPVEKPTLLPVPRSKFMIWVNLAAALIVAAIGFGVGFGQGLRAQDVIVSTVISVAVLLILLNYVAVLFEDRALRAATPEQSGGARSVWRANRVLIIAMALLLLVYLIVTATVPEFRSVRNLIAFLVLEAILLFAFKVSGVFVHGRSAFIGVTPRRCQSMRLRSTIWSAADIVRNFRSSRSNCFISPGVHGSV